VGRILALHGGHHGWKCCDGNAAVREAVQKSAVLTKRVESLSADYSIRSTPIFCSFVVCGSCEGGGGRGDGGVTGRECCVTFSASYPLAVIMNLNVQTTVGAPAPQVTPGPDRPKSSILAPNVILQMT